jgi:hypothetical protein
MTMQRTALLVALIATACTRNSGTRVATDGGGKAASTSFPSSEEDACLDRWLAEHQLDPFGAARGTAYAGGTPIFDETTASRESRAQYVYARHPAARSACALDAGRSISVPPDARSDQAASTGR